MTILVITVYQSFLWLENFLEIEHNYEFVFWQRKILRNFLELPFASKIPKEHTNRKCEEGAKFAVNWLRTSNANNLW